MLPYLLAVGPPTRMCLATQATQQYDALHNITNRGVARRTGVLASRPWRQCTRHETEGFYRHYRVLFDIRGGEDGLSAQSLAFCDNSETCIVATSEGGIALFDTRSEHIEDKLKEQHIVFEDDSLWDVQVSRSNELIAAAGECRFVHIMRRDALPVAVCKLEGCKTIRFAATGDDVVLATNDKAKSCSLYDVSRAQVIQEYCDEDGAGNMIGIENYKNVAQFDHTSQLLLNDATLWDRRCPKPIFHFDRITESFYGFFHSNNRCVIIDKSVLDLRTLTMSFSCPALQQSQLHFIDSDYAAATPSVIFAFRDGEFHHSTLSVIDGHTFDTVATYDIHPTLKGFAVDRTGSLFAGLQDGDTDVAVRLFGCGLEPDEEGNHVNESEEPAEDDIDGTDSELDYGDEGDTRKTRKDRRSLVCFTVRGIRSV